MEYANYVVDECGDVVACVSTIGIDRAEEIIEEHPEYSLRCIPYGEDF